MKLSAWNVDHNNWQKNGSLIEKLKFLVRYAILAPSGHNTQPWIFKISQDTIELHSDSTRCLPIVDPENRELIISCGCSLYFLKIAARKFGYHAHINEFPDPSSPDLLAIIKISQAEPASEEELALFNAITRRHTNRNTFESRMISETTINRLISMTNQEDICLHIISDDIKRNAIVDLIAMGDRMQASNKIFRRELSSWVHPNRSKHLDGMPCYAFDVSDFTSTLLPLVLRYFDWGNSQAAKDRQLALGSPVLAILSSKSDTKSSWLNTGQALASILLKAASEGISASFFNQPIELEELRVKVTELLDTDGFPQIVFRLGYGPEVKPTPRRGLDEVLLS
ncbi:MAG: nitroreductase family protein [Spirochaetia bacterium]|nr:nitroreductase family protein [Spirochaetia bacterium]